jgi:hypothetical protein
MNTNEVTDWADDNRDGSADTGVVADAVERASRDIWSYIQGRYSATAGMPPEAYTEGSGAFPILESKAAILAADYLRWRQGRGAQPDEDHPVMQWATRVKHFFADVVAT